MSLSDLLRSKQDANILIAIELIKGMKKKYFIEEMVILYNDLLTIEDIGTAFYYRLTLMNRDLIRLSIDDVSNHDATLWYHRLVISYEYYNYNYGFINEDIHITMSDPPKMNKSMTHVNTMLTTFASSEQWPEK